MLRKEALVRATHTLEMHPDMVMEQRDPARREADRKQGVRRKQTLHRPEAGHEEAWPALER